MSWDYGFGELENQLIEAGKEYPPNYEKMRELLAAGANINATSTEEDPDESILSTISWGIRKQKLLRHVSPVKKREKIHALTVWIISKGHTMEDISLISVTSFCKTDLMFMAAMIHLAVAAL